jgi:hypothetical protein
LLACAPRSPPFHFAEAKGIVLRQRADLTVDATLQIGKVAESITAGGAHLESWSGPLVRHLGLLDPARLHPAPESLGGPAESSI